MRKLVDSASAPEQPHPREISALWQRLWIGPPHPREISALWRRLWGVPYLGPKFVTKTRFWIKNSWCKIHQTFCRIGFVPPSSQKGQGFHTLCPQNKKEQRVRKNESNRQRVTILTGPDLIKQKGSRFCLWSKTVPRMFTFANRLWKEAKHIWKQVHL